MNLHPVELGTLTPEVLRVFGTQPPLLTAGDKSGCNTMTIGWCPDGPAVESAGMHGVRTA